MSEQQPKIVNHKKRKTPSVTTLQEIEEEKNREEDNDLYSGGKRTRGKLRSKSRAKSRKKRRKSRRKSKGRKRRRKNLKKRTKRRR